MNRQQPFSSKQERWVRLCAYVMLIVGLFNLLILVPGQIIQPWMYTDVLTEELKGLDCRDEATRRIKHYFERTTINRMVFPGINGAMSLFAGAALLVIMRRTNSDVPDS